MYNRVFYYCNFPTTGSTRPGLDKSDACELFVVVDEVDSILDGTAGTTQRDFQTAMQRLRELCGKSAVRLHVMCMSATLEGKHMQDLKDLLAIDRAARVVFDEEEQAMEMERLARAVPKPDWVTECAVQRAQPPSLEAAARQQHEGQRHGQGGEGGPCGASAAGTAPFAFAMGWRKGGWYMRLAPK